jgi:hypothetical protein
MTPGGSTPEACIFCEDASAQLTVEDVLPRWLLRMWRSEPPARGDVTHVSLDVATGIEKAQTRRRLKLEAPVVCMRCNTQWMSNIQNRASASLKAMIRGRVTPLDAAARRWLAAWTFMTACTWEFTMPSRYIPASKRHELFAFRDQPPPGFVAWVGAYMPRPGQTPRLGSNATFPLYGHSHTGEPLPADAQGYAGTIHLGTFIAQFVGHTIDGTDFGLDRGAEADLYFADIWPEARCDPVIWPGRFALDDGGLDMATMAWIRNPWIKT